MEDGGRHERATWSRGTRPVRFRLRWSLTHHQRTHLRNNNVDDTEYATTHLLANEGLETTDDSNDRDSSQHHRLQLILFQVALLIHDFFSTPTTSSLAQRVFKSEEKKVACHSFRFHEVDNRHSVWLQKKLLNNDACHPTFPASRLPLVRSMPRLPFASGAPLHDVGMY